MVKIRLTRTGRKNFPSYRIVAIEHAKKRDGENIEILGYYNPSKTPVELEIDKGKVEEWVKKGAQVSDTVKELINGTYKYVKYEPNSISSKEQSNPEKAEEPVATKESVEPEKVTK